MQKYANLVELEKCCQTHIFLQKSVSIQPRTNPPKICRSLRLFANFANRHAKDSASRSPGLAGPPHSPRDVWTRGPVRKVVRKGKPRLPPVGPAGRSRPRKKEEASEKKMEQSCSCRRVKAQNRCRSPERKPREKRKRCAAEAELFHQRGL